MDHCRHQIWLDCFLIKLKGGLLPALHHFRGIPIMLFQKICVTVIHLGATDKVPLIVLLQIIYEKERIMVYILFPWSKIK